LEKRLDVAEVLDSRRGSGEVGKVAVTSDTIGWLMQKEVPHNDE
jgi:hypothetical protein